MKNIIFFLFLASFSLNVLAIDGFSVGLISQVRVQASYNRILIAQENSTNPGNCSKTDYLYLSANDDVLHRDMYSALLVAYSGSKETMLGLEGCSSAGRPIIVDVWIK